jgi:uncharacterized repeat protein (TIGR03803 family)
MGVVFELSPPSLPGGEWTETPLWSFCAAGGFCPDGMYPVAKLTMDSAGNLYGTTVQGGAYEYGTVFELTPGSGSLWNETVLYSFTDSENDGRNPSAGVTLDSAGNLYGTTKYGGTNSARCSVGCGTVFELAPNGDGTWNEILLFTGTDRLGYFEADLSWDHQGNLHTAAFGVPDESEGGVLTLNRASGWKPSGFVFDGTDGAAPSQGVLVRNGVLYGTTTEGGNSQTDAGTIFSLAGKTETVLYEFCSQPVCADGANPGSGGFLLPDEAGNLYGTFRQGGANQNGGVFKITP